VRFDEGTEVERPPPTLRGWGFQITDSGNLSVPGSVGIGTTDPIGNIGLHLKTSQWAFTSTAGMVIQAATSNDDPGLMLFIHQARRSVRLVKLLIRVRGQ